MADMQWTIIIKIHCVQCSELITAADGLAHCFRWRSVVISQ